MRYVTVGVFKVSFLFEYGLNTVVDEGFEQIFTEAVFKFDRHAIAKGRCEYSFSSHNRIRSFVWTLS